jgi:hypothetical protein
MEMLIVKTIVINGKIHKNKRKMFYSSNKEVSSARSTAMER